MNHSKTQEMVWNSPYAAIAVESKGRFSAMGFSPSRNQMFFFLPCPASPGGDHALRGVDLFDHPRRFSARERFARCCAVRFGGLENGFGGCESSRAVLFLRQEKGHNSVETRGSCAIICLKFGLSNFETHQTLRETPRDVETLGKFHVVQMSYNAWCASKRTPAGQNRMLLKQVLHMKCQRNLRRQLARIPRVNAAKPSCPKSTLPIGSGTHFEPAGSTKNEPFPPSTERNRKTS